MPKLSFDDVFLSEKSDVVEKVMDLQKQLQVQSIVITHLMMEKGVTTISVDRKEFTRHLEESGLKEPVTMGFSGDGNHVTLTLGVDNDDSDSRE